MIMFNQCVFKKGNTRLCVFILLFLITLPNITVVFAEVSKTETVLSSIDTMVSMSDPLSNYGGYTEMIVSKSTNPFIGVHDAYLQFNLTELPEGITVTSAMLILRASEGRTTQTISVYSCGNQQWDEYISTWMDFQDMPLQFLDSVTIPYLAEFEWDITEAVKSSLSQEYFTLKVASESWTDTGYVKFYSREGESLSTLLKIEWPRISVSYSIPDTTPPDISEISYRPTKPDEEDTIYCEAQITDAESDIKDAFVLYRINNGATQKIAMTQGSEESVYYARIPEQKAGSTVSFGFSATDSAGNIQTSGTTTLEIKEKALIPSFPMFSVIFGLLLSIMIMIKMK